jgi:hypothetical protein
VFGSTLALLQGWCGEQLALKLAYDFGLRLDKFCQLFTSQVVKLAWLADCLRAKKPVKYQVTTTATSDARRLQFA